MQWTNRVRRLAPSPQEFDELVLTNGGARAEREPSEQRALQTGAEGGPDIAVPDLDRAEHANAQRSATDRTGTGGLPIGHGRGVEPFGILPGRAERDDDGLHRATFRASRPALFQVADRAGAHPGPVSQLSLRHARAPTVGAEQLTETCRSHSRPSWVVGPLVSAVEDTWQW
jgi:hypothetical protein